MDRATKFMKFCEEYSGRTFMGQNISKIHDNLESAEKNGALKDFILNKKPYQSAFPFLPMEQHVAKIKWLSLLP